MNAITLEDPAFSKLYADVLNEHRGKLLRRMEKKKSSRNRRRRKRKQDFHIPPFTIHEIRKAYRETELTPSEGIVYWNSAGVMKMRAYVDDERVNACPLGALCIYREGDFVSKPGESWFSGAVASLLKVPHGFVMGFNHGFDGGPAPHPRTGPHYHQGYDNGRQIRDIMLSTGELIIVLDMIEDEPPADLEWEESDSDVSEEPTDSAETEEDEEDDEKDAEEKRDEVKQIIVIRRDLKMRRGKEIAQGSHASMSFMTRRIQSAQELHVWDAQDGKRVRIAFSEAEMAWIKGRFKKVCVKVNSEEELLELHRKAQDVGLESHLITDRGLTEFSGVPTNTAIAIGPDYASKLDPITGKLPLY